MCVCPAALLGHNHREGAEGAPSHPDELSLVGGSSRKVEPECTLDRVVSSRLCIVRCAVVPSHVLFLLFRMLSNRESARRSRRRKHEHLMAIESQVSMFGNQGSNDGF